MKRQTTRRTFLRNTGIAAAGVVILKDAATLRGFQANDRVNVALIGVGGRGRWFVDTIPKMANVVALCDVNQMKIAEALKRWTDLSAKFADSPNSWEVSAAKEYKRLLAANLRTFPDFRNMLDEMDKEIDAVVISTPDHTHAVASAAAMKHGKHVYCEKPLTRLVGESRALAELARKHKVATSMGNQGTAAGPFRRALELIRDGSLGQIKEVHVWNSGGGSDRTEPPKDTPPVPGNLNWDLWLGPAAVRPFHPDWLRRNTWRDFGTCQLGNWAPHTANLAFMSLHVHDLWLSAPTGAHPIVRIEAKSSGINRLSFPKWEVVKWEIPARGQLPPIVFTWYNGNPPGAAETVRPLMGEKAEGGKFNPLDFAGTLVVGAKGTIHATGHNATFRLLPEAQFKDVATDSPAKVERSRGHEMDWLLACRGGKPAWASFDYASALNELLMLGNAATQFEGKLDFDPVACRITNHADADKVLRPNYRAGWSL